jgi:hypothetical protein
MRLNYPVFNAKLLKNGPFRERGWGAVQVLTGIFPDRTDRAPAGKFSAG